MQILIDFLEDIKEIAVVNAMNAAASVFNISAPQGGTEAAKQQLINLITGEVKEDGTIVLTLDMMQSVRVAPLYGLFAGAWATPKVQEGTLNFLKRAPVFDGVTFDLQLRSK